MGREAIEEEGSELLVVAAKIESEIAEFEDAEERGLFLQELGLKESGVNRLIKAAYKLLNLSVFLTAGPLEVRAWPFKTGSKAPVCAGIVHMILKRFYSCRSHQIRGLYPLWIGTGRKRGRQNARRRQRLRGSGRRYHIFPF